MSRARSASWAWSARISGASARRSSLASWPAVAWRSCGRFAIARWMTSSTAAGTGRSGVEIGGTGLWTCWWRIDIGTPWYGTRPAKIRYTITPSA